MAAPLSLTCRRVSGSLLKYFNRTKVTGHFMPSNRNLLKLKERGIFQTLFPEDRAAEFERALIGKPQCVYCGFDPTADSLHVGNLLALMALLHCQRAGHRTVVVLGGATSRIGDPSGKTKERSPLNENSIEENTHQIARLITKLFQHHGEYFWSGKSLEPPIILNNNEWYQQINVVEFLSTVGRHFRMGQLLGRTSVQTRLNSAEGMSLTEFTYQIFQSYDWLHLSNKYNCTVQVGGNDQTGNIVAGHDLISRVTNKNVYGLTVPLIKTTTGDKLGKTAGNAVWLNSNKTSPFELYQYFLQLADSEVEKYLKLFTFLPDNEIDDILLAHKRRPEDRRAQKKVAEHVTLLVHGEAGLKSAVQCTKVLFDNSVEDLMAMSGSQLEDLFRNAKTVDLLLDPGMSILDTVMAAGCFSRKTDGQRIIKAGGVSFNQQKVQEPDFVLIPMQHILPNNITLIRVGKKNYYIVRWLGGPFPSSDISE